MSYQWQIFIASLDPIQGSEQSGKRPVLVISQEQLNQLLPIVNVIPSLEVSLMTESLGKGL